MNQPKIVLDSNVIISALLWSGLPHQILQLAENHNILIFSSMEILDEVFKVLKRPKLQKRINELHTSPDELIESLLGVVEIVHSRNKLYVIINDPDDNKIIECAVASEADHIITGDPHLLKLKRYGNIVIVNPRKYLF
ncbi:MAG: putative toxin-antitoxin system toxin component, PIN family [Candidatus Margulisbacteria bacterium]|nr:putative toxin-antitoxin system toxin component, PIN family [Candidatus Margulisiibacteriota bacterium]